MSILNKINTAYNNNQAFVCYRKPNELNTTLLIQNDDSLYRINDLTEQGFVFAPFDNRNDSILIPIDKAQLFEEKQPLYDYSLSNDNDTFEANTSSKKQHEELVELGVKAIISNTFKKVVLSRNEKVQLKNFNITNTFQKLLFLYPTAFVYVWFHPKVGLWLGATPETLIKINQNKFETMSLAGTQVFQPDKKIVWQQKEIEEQQFVTDYILEKLRPITNNIKTEGLTTIKAGNLLHLHTKIIGEHKNNIATLIDALHPTPAVCGLPKESAKQFILDKESYDRSFYTGYLGELNLNKCSYLYVNLRCMKISNNKANIYVGGGITKDSNSENEWLETVAKTSTMKKVL